MPVKTYKKTEQKQLTKHFKLSEVHCHGKECCHTTKIDLDVVKLAERMRCALGVPITVESGYRCYTHNKAVGGANGSGHCVGTALDLTTAKVSRERLAVLAELVGVPRIGIYKTDNKKCMIHIGMGKRCHWINTGNYLSDSHSFIPVPYRKPALLVAPKSDKRYIAWVQAWLFAKGYKGKDNKEIKIDGVWGVNTQYAVDSFRKGNGWGKAKYLKTKAIKTLCNVE